MYGDEEIIKEYSESLDNCLSKFNLLVNQRSGDMMEYIILNVEKILDYCLEFSLSHDKREEFFLKSVCSLLQNNPILTETISKLIENKYPQFKEKFNKVIVLV